MFIPRSVVTMLLVVLAACDRQPVAPLDEASVAASLVQDAEAGTNDADRRPGALLRRLVRQIRAGDNEPAQALLARADELRRRARAEGNRELAREARGLTLQAVVLQFPAAAARISAMVRTRLERVRAALGDRDAPRIRRVLEEIGTLLRQSASAQQAGSGAEALDYALQAANRLGRLVEHVRSRGGEPGQ